MIEIEKIGTTKNVLVEKPLFVQFSRLAIIPFFFFFLYEGFGFVPICYNLRASGHRSLRCDPDQLFGECSCLSAWTLRLTGCL